MSGNVPVVRDKLAAAQKRLELRWCSWPGDWESFLEVVERDATDVELIVLERWPAEFRVAALERAERIERWQENRLMTYLSQMDKLSDATKTCMKTGDIVPDNSTRLKANAFLIERAMGSIKEAKSPDTPTGRVGLALVERREKLRQVLKERREVIDVEVEVVEAESGDESPPPDGVDAVTPDEQ